MWLAVDATVLGIRSKGSVGQVVARDMLPGIALLTEDGCAVKCIVVKTANALDSIWLFLIVLLVLKRLQRTVTW